MCVCVCIFFAGLRRKSLCLRLAQRTATNACTHTHTGSTNNKNMSETRNDLQQFLHWLPERTEELLAEACEVRRVCVCARAPHHLRHFATALLFGHAAGHTFLGRMLWLLHVASLHFINKPAHVYYTCIATVHSAPSRQARVGLLDGRSVSGRCLAAR